MNHRNQEKLNQILLLVPKHRSHPQFMVINDITVVLPTTTSSSMNLYDVRTSETHAISIFARSYSHALDLFITFWVIAGNGEFADIQIKQHNPHWLGFNIEHLRRALLLGIPGIARYDPAVGWTIFPPERFEEIA